MDKVLADAGLSECAWAYVDDVLIASTTLEEHILDIERVLQALHNVGLRVHPGKSVFCSDKMEYLGHVVTPRGLEPQAAKVAAMANLPVPTSVPVLQSFMGLLNYYRHFVPNFSSIAKPLNQLLQKGTSWQWGPEQQQAFDALKRQLCTEGLVLRRADPTKPYIVHSDWSQNGIGAVLAQLDEEGNEYMVACASRSLNVHERNYTPWKGELLAVVWAIKTFRVYLHGVHFELCTDHRPLLWLLNQQEPTGQHARWVLSLMEYDYHVRHRAGVEHVNADVLSRFPNSGPEDGTGAQLDASTDPIQARLPPVVFGPVGTGTPTDVAPEQIPIDPPMPLSYRPVRGGASGPAGAAAGAAAGDAVWQEGTQAGADNIGAQTGPSPAPRRRQTKAQFRKKHQSPYAAVALWDSYADPVAFTALAVTAAQCRASFVGRQLALANDAIDDHTFSQWDPWELPHSQVEDPLIHMHVQPWAAEQQQQLRQRATLWVAAAAAPTESQHSPVPRSPSSLDTRSVAHTFFPAAKAGVVLFEPFGGLCAGLEMALRNGIPIHAYIYSDISADARAVAQHRLQLLQSRFPGLLPASALTHTFNALPQDVWDIQPAHMQHLAQQFQRQWLVVGGWECQDLSSAGNSKGLHGDKSSTLAALVNILAALQRCQPQFPPAYVIENTAMQYNFRSEQVRVEDFNLICQALGRPICLDSTQFDSLAHRVRNYWTNLCTPAQMAAAVEQVQRTPGLQVQAAIDPDSGRKPAMVRRNDRSHGGRYPANKRGHPMSAWPTFVAFEMSRAFKAGRPGAMWDPAGGLKEPTADERERAMGYVAGDTKADGLTELQRREVLGKCIDANTLQSIMAIAAAWHRRQQWVPGRAELLPACTARVLEEAVGVHQSAAQALSLGADLTASHQCEVTIEQYLVGLAVAAVAEAREGDPSDIWQDEQALQYLRDQQFDSTWEPATRSRIRKRAAKYRLAGDGQLRRVFPDGSTKLVPKPADREALITQFHNRNGHFGVRRTGALISTGYWWWGMWSDVAATLSKCGLCSRVRSSFGGEQPELHPLPISGLMYRWGVDLCGPFPTTARQHQFVMVAVEHYSKHLELVPIPNKEPATTAAAFAAAVLGRYGSPAEVVTDRGGEWMREFEQLLLECMIDHRHTSASHPAANGLSERCVATTKRALSKLCAQQGDQGDWDLQLPWIMLGYNASPQQSTGLSPYQLMHAVTPTVPPAIRERLSQPIDLDNPEVAAADFLARANLVKERAVIAGDNLLIAQHRDTLRYAKLRSGAYTPQLRRYLPGDYVWVRKHHKTGLDIGAKQLILRVQEVRPSGVLILQGRCGTLRAVHASQCAPCHLPDIDPQVDWSLGKPPPQAVCENCGEDDSEERGHLIFCDNCNHGWHLGCHRPQLDRQPSGTWVCQPCVGQGITLEAVKALQRASDQQAALQQQPEKHRPSDLRARTVDGRLIQKLFTKPGRGGGTQWYWGRVHYRGKNPGGELLIVYEDGDAEITTLRRLQNQQIQWMPEGTALPAGMRLRTAAAAETDIASRERPIRAGRGGAITQGRGGAITQGRGGEIMQGRGGNYRGEQSRRRSPRRPTEAAAFAIVSQQLRPALTAAAASDTGGVVPSGVPTYLTHICICISWSVSGTPFSCQTVGT